MLTPRTETSTILLRQLQAESNLIEKQKLQDQLWEHLHEEGTPIISKQENGKYQVTFLYQSQDDKTVELDCPDLYDRMLDERGTLKKFEKILGTDVYFLQFDNVPQNAFAPYNIVLKNEILLVTQLIEKNENQFKNTFVIIQNPPGFIHFDENGQKKEIFDETETRRIFKDLQLDKLLTNKLIDSDNMSILGQLNNELLNNLQSHIATKNVNLFLYKSLSDPLNSKSLLLYRYEIASRETKSYLASYVPLSETKLPNWVKNQPPDEPHRAIESYSIHKSGAFSDREAWIYKPKEFNPSDGKVIFILDGEHFCKTLTPYLDAMRQSEDNLFSNTAFVFVNPGTYAFGPPGRVQEYYMRNEEFSEFLAKEIANLCKILGIDNQTNIILAGHSLAAYPILGVASKSQVGGVLLFSPEILCSKHIPIPEPKKPGSFPIYIQVGQLEDVIPPKAWQGEAGQHKLNQSRCVADEELYYELIAQGFSQTKINVHTSGHNEIHVIDGLVKGLQFIYSKRFEAQSNVNPKYSTSHINEGLGSRPSLPSLHEQEQIKNQEQIKINESTLIPSPAPANEVKEKNDAPKKLTP